MSSLLLSCARDRAQPTSFTRETQLAFYAIAAMLSLAALEAMLAYRRKRAPLPEPS